VVEGLARGWTVRGSNPGSDKDFLFSTMSLGPIQPLIQCLPEFFAKGKATRACI